MIAFCNGSPIVRMDFGFLEPGPVRASNVRGLENSVLVDLAGSRWYHTCCYSVITCLPRNHDLEACMRERNRNGERDYRMCFENRTSLLESQTQQPPNKEIFTSCYLRQSLQCYSEDLRLR